jgi:DNA-binding CsgD family transcriptional regulator
MVAVAARQILTRREREILALVAEGYQSKEIARELGLAVWSVKGHLKRTYAKLQVDNRIRAVARARELGLLYRDEDLSAGGAL